MAVNQLSKKDVDGTVLGQDATDKIGFYGKTPVVQAAHIADATDLTTALTRIAAILVVLENVGITASS